MATELLATGATALQSSDIVVAAGSIATVFLKDAAGPDVPQDAVVLIEIKDSAGQYFTIGSMTRQQSAKVLTGPATFRLNRPVQTSAVGAEQG